MDITELLIAKGLAEQTPYATDPSVMPMLAQAQLAQNVAQPSLAEAAGIGGVLGAAPFVGAQVDAVFRGKKPGQKERNRFKRGPRFAGGLVSALIGGGLGAGLRETAIQDSPAAALLAKAQSGGLTQEDAALLQSVLKDTYKEMGIA